MSENENSPSHPPATQDIFFASHTAPLEGTSLTAFAGRINGRGELVLGVLLADFCEALTGTRDRFRELMRSKTLKSRLNVDLGSTIYPLRGVHAGDGNPKVITTDGIAKLSAALIESNIAGELERAPRLKRSAEQLALMQVRAAAEGWRVALRRSLGLEEHESLPMAATVHQRRLVNLSTFNYLCAFEQMPPQKRRVSMVHAAMAVHENTLGEEPDLRLQAAFGELVQEGIESHQQTGLTFSGADEVIERVRGLIADSDDPRMIERLSKIIDALDN